MKHTTALLALLALVLLGCQQPSDDKDDNDTPSSADETISQDLSGLDGEVALLYSKSDSLTKARTVAIDVTVPANSEVYYLITNTSSDPSQAVDLGGVATKVARSATAPLQKPEVASKAVERREHPGLFDRVGARWRPSAGRSVSGAFQAAYTVPQVGNTTTFRDSVDLGDTPATLRYRSAEKISDRYLNVWVADDCWGGAGDVVVTQAMVDALAEKFLVADENNDIYDWVTTMVGREWADAGETPQSGLIDGHGDIHIFLLNLNPNGTDDGVLMGYFDATNNFLTTADDETADSNEKILFALDAGSLANSDDDGSDETTDDQGTWALTDYWPAEIVSTLAHEFQHMVHFYQKQVLHFDGTWKLTETWVNEMASLITEDLVADKLNIPGPRGVALKDGAYDYSTGDAANLAGRLPLYNYSHDEVALTDWNHPGSVLYNYANAYAFGAWAFRNFGGPLFLKNVVQNEYYDEQAVVKAVNSVAQGFGQDYTSLVRDWGAATFLGGNTAVGATHFWAYGITGGAFSWNNVTDFGSITRNYKAGSINLYKYRYWWGNQAGQYVNGPWIWDGFPTEEWPLPAGASLYAIISDQASGKYTDTLNLPAHLAVTVAVVAP